jgi:hypothetical protein
MLGKPAYADFLVPGVVLIVGASSWWIVLSVLIVEFILLWVVFGFSVQRAFMTDVVMNTASAIVGYIFSPFLEMFLAHDALPRVVFLPIFVIIAVLINVLVEKKVIHRLNDWKLGLKDTCWLAAANLITVTMLTVYIVIESDTIVRWIRT